MPSGLFIFLIIRPKSAVKLPVSVEHLALPLDGAVSELADVGVAVGTFELAVAVWDLVGVVALINIAVRQLDNDSIVWWRFVSTVTISH